MSKPLSPLQEFWYCFSYNKASLFGMVYIIIMIFVALFADLLAYHSPTEQFRQFLLTPPVWQEGGNWQFILGTDDLGRDILSRLIYATRVSLFVGSLVVLISLIIGVSIGLFSGYVGGLVDVFIMRIVDIMLAIPALLQALVLVVIFGFSIFSMSFILSFTALPSYIRLTRARVLLEMEQEYIVASQVVGSSALRQMFINILPNCFDSLIVQASLCFSGAVLNMAALGFLGMGVQPPTPEWGNMLSDVLQFTQTAWWLVTFPGLAILLTVLALNLIGDGLRDALDPKTKSL